MTSVKRSLQERLNYILEDGCAACGGGGMAVGDGGFTADAAPEGPVAGYDPLLKVKRQKKKRKGVNEGKKPLPDFKMMLKASNLETKEEKDKEKAHRNAERARKIRANM